MTRRLLEINDVAVTVADASGNLVTSPGQIICGEGRREAPRVGRDASERRRINPRATHDRFWSALDRAPLPHAAGPARSNADLVWLHLRELLAALDRDEDDSWIIIVPAAYDDDQLALLLGIARSLDIRVERLISAPVIAAAAAGMDRQSLVVDAHWHRFSADRVEASGNGLRLDSDGLPDSRVPGSRGLGALLDAWAGVVNDIFVSQTRFDPSHDAVVEQRLYNRLPEWLARMARGEDVVAELEVGQHYYRVELSAGAFISVAEPFYRGLTDPIRRAGADSLILRHRLAGLPGLAQHFAEAGHAEPHWLDERAVARTALELPALRIAGDDGAVALTLKMSTRAPTDRGSAVRSHPDAEAGSNPDSRSDPEPIESAPEAPSHVLVDGRALPIDASGLALTAHWRIEHATDGTLVLAARAAESGRPPATLNGRPADDGAALQIGDRIAIGDDGEEEFVLLRVADGGPA